MEPDADQYEIVPVSDTHLDDVLRLRLTFRGISADWNARHWRWQQDESPWFEGHLGQLALHRGRVVGMRILQAAEWEAGRPAVRFRAPCLTGTIIEEGHRSRGLMSRLSRALERQVRDRDHSFAFNLNAGPVTLVGALADGWRSLGAFGAVSRAAASQGTGLVGNASRALRRALFALLPPPGRGIAVSDDPRPDDMAALAASAGADGRIRHVKNADWFRWRYRDPSSRYRFAYFERGGRLVAYLAFHRAAAPLPAAAVTLVDWERDPSIDWTELLGTAIRLADRWVLPLHAWTRALPPEIGPRLPELGFEPRPLWGPLASRRPTFLVGRMGDDAAAASTRDEDGWAVAGRRLDRLDDWNLRPVFADAY